MTEPTYRLRSRPGTLLALIGLLADWPSRLRLLAIKLAMQVPPLRRLIGSRLVTIRLRPLGGRSFRIRPLHQDLATVVHAMLEGQHLPPPEVRALALGRICELGANVGASVSALAALYPEAEVLGIEPDPGNAAVARVNAAEFGGRCRIVEAAVWDAETDLVIEDAHSTGLTVRAPAHGEAGAGRLVRAFTLDQLLDSHLSAGDIDYLHMCIEGSEPRVLAAGGRWPERVGSIRVELYPDQGFGGDECDAALHRLGYRAWHEVSPHSAYGFGVRA